MPQGAGKALERVTEGEQGKYGRDGLYGNTPLKDPTAFSMTVQPDSNGTIWTHLPQIRCQKQRVGEPRRPLSIVLRTSPRKEPVYGRRS
ncbi:hypothetical protein [Tunturiibacter psychrotolerans]|uniref:hypothetical protein n=1 Tax=Tunturiibacter psychrotolerans TaxID=3069686 RepID=UPI003D1F024B